MTGETILALLVEDNPGDARLIQEALAENTEPRFHLEWAEDLGHALKILKQKSFAIILLDLSLPDSQGMHTVKNIEQAAPDTPIVVLTGLDDEALAVEAVRSGAQDYLVKSDATSHLLARVMRYAIERQRIGRALHENEARLTALFEHMGSAVAVYQPSENGEDFVFSAFNRAAEQIEHLSRDQVVGKKLLEVFPAARDFGFIDVLKRVQQSGEAERFPVKFYKDGRIAGWRDNYIYKLPNGEIVAIYDDVTERRRNEESLRLAAKVFESSTAGIVITDTAGSVLNVNDAFTRITGYSLAEIRGATPRLLKSGRHDDAFYREMWDSLLASGHWQGEIWNKRKNGEIYPEWMDIGIVKDDRGEASHFVGTFTDITQRKADEERINYLGHHDALTGLPNRTLLHDRISQTLATCQHQHYKAALLLIDLDRFKNINESLNHDFGDRLLQLVAGRLDGCIHAPDTLARSGGDEFVVLMGEVHHLGEIVAMAKALLTAMNQPFLVKDQEITITSSIGISVYPDDGDDTQTLLKNADVAMYRAKEQGRNNYQFYTQGMNVRTFETLVLENSLRHALTLKQFELHYQPQLDIASSAIIGMEALIRLRHPELGLISPANFIPIAEETGLIVPIGEWVVQQACAQTKAWHDLGYGTLRVAVNLSARQFRQPGLMNAIEKALADSGLPPARLELELTESILMQDTEETLATLLGFKSMGVQLSIDDFGTGFSSLGYLKRFNLDKLKIDQSFIHDITSDPNDLAIARAVIALGHSLNLKVIAEGVETAEQLALLRENGCDEMQGFYFSRPLPADDFLRLLQERKKAGKT
ncbi:MAG: EAL domain-containing protein [Betaproteobacteria bacterium]|nr:EAL domain-containing protein [Betaproteobacteria bacterium]